MTHEPILRLRDVASRLGVCVRTVRRWIAKGQLQALRLPSGHYRILAASLPDVQCAKVPDADTVASE